MIVFESSLGLDGGYHYAFINEEPVFKGADAMGFLREIGEAELVSIPMSEAEQFVRYLERGADEHTVLRWVLSEAGISEIEVLVGAEEWYYGSVFCLFESRALRTVRRALN